jgi:sugar lactone lactonase YvrE
MTFLAPACAAPETVWDAGAQLGEGLCWSVARQALYWIDILGQRLYRMDWPARTRRKWAFDETISTVAERAAGSGLVIALRHRVACFDPDGGTLEVLHEVEADRPGNRLNDGKCDRQGRFWVGSMDLACKSPTGSLYRVTPHDRQVACLWRDNFPVNNGPAWSPDGRTMWVNDTARNVVHRCDFDPAAGTLAHVAPWLRLARGDGYPDGMTTDRDGRLWIAHWGGGCVTCHAGDDGRELGRIALPATNITNVAFGGPDLRTLFVSSAAAELPPGQRAKEPLAGALFAVATDAVGLPADRYAG